MEITFQNKPSDFEAFYDYILTKTRDGQQLGKRLFFPRQFVFILMLVLFSVSVWGILGHFRVSLGFSSLVALIVFVSLFIVIESLLLLIAGFRPIYSAGKEVYKNEEKQLTPRELQIFQLPRTLIIDDTWLEVRNTEAVHRWRWRRVSEIGLTSEWVVIHVDSCTVVYVPKRDFPSEQAFLEFGNKLVELKEKSKEQPIGTE